MDVVWLHRARHHLAEISAYIADDNPTAAISVRQWLEEAVLCLAAHPERGRQGRIDGTRELANDGLPYIIPYRVRHGRIEILAVIHAPPADTPVRRNRCPPTQAGV